MKAGGTTSLTWDPLTWHYYYSSCCCAGNSVNTNEANWTNGRSLDIFSLTREKREEKKT